MQGINDFDDVDDLLEKLVKTQRNLSTCVNEIPHLLNDAVGGKDIEKLRLGIHEMLDRFNSVIGPLVEAKNGSEKRIQQLETSCGELMHYYEVEQKKVEKLEQQIRELAEESAGQVAFCTHLGAVLGNLVWKSSRSSPLVDNWLQENRQNLDNFLSITNTALDSFILTFSGNFPDVNQAQCQFMMSLMGTIANISSNSTGRAFLMNHKNGKDLIKMIVRCLPSVPSGTGDGMKRLMLMILYNVSLNCSGLPYLLHLKIHELIANCSEESPEIQLNTLRIIQSITYDLKDSSIFDRLLKLLPVIKIEEFMTSSDERIADAAKGVLVNIKKFYATADTISDMSTDNRSFN